MHIDLPLIFKDKIVSIIAGGSSLIGFDFSRLQGKIIAVNHTIKYVKADMFLALDTIVWSHLYKDIDELESRGGYLLNDSRRYTPRQEFTRIVLDPFKDLRIKKSNNTGLLALAVALHLGARRVYLFGFDGYVGKQSHFYKNQKFKDKEDRKKLLTSHLYHYEIFKDEPVINVGLKSKIKYFKKVDINSDIYIK